MRRTHRAGTRLISAIVWLMTVGHTTLATEGSESATLTLSVLNAANVARDELTGAQQEVTTIYAAAGIAVQWLGADGASSNSSSSDCSLRLTIVIATHTPRVGRGRADNVMGIVPDGNGAHRRHAYVFHKRVAEFARTHKLLLPPLLGYVIAHEVGHLLLPPNAHAVTGIMRAEWELQHLRDAARGRLRFTAAQARAIKHTIAADLESRRRSAQGGKHDEDDNSLSVTVNH